MAHRRSFLAAGLAAMAGCRPRRGAGFPGYAFVANEEGQAVAAVDLTAFAVARYIKLAGDPTAVVAHATRPSVYALTPANAVVHEIATGDLRLRRGVQVARSAISLRLAPDGSALWILCREPRQLARVPVDQFRPDATIALPREPVDFELSGSGQWCGISFGKAGLVALADLANCRLEQAVELGGETATVRFRSDDKCLLAANVGERLLSVLEVPTGRVVTHLPLAVRPDNFCAKADGGQLFITGEGSDAVVIVYPHKTPQVAETVLAARAPGAMAASALSTAPDGATLPDYLFIASPRSGDVSIMNIETRRVVAVAAVGAEPGYITITPDQQYALVLNRRSGDMAVIRVASMLPRRGKAPPPLFTMIPVGSKPVAAAVRAV